MRIQLVHHAEEHEVFMPEAFASQIGKEVPVRMPTGSERGKLVGAIVSADGKEVVLTLEVEDV